MPTGRGAEPDLRAATVFDRTLLRAGETVSMKHFIRTETATGLAAVPAAELPTSVKLVHQGSGQEFTLPAAVERRRSQRRHHLEHSAGGQARRLRGSTPERSTPSRVRREGERAKRQRSWASGDFRVEEFRLPLVDARLSGAEGRAGRAGELSRSTCR